MAHPSPQDADVVARKTSLRRTARAARRGLSSEERAAASTTVVDRLLTLPDLHRRHPTHPTGDGGGPGRPMTDAPGTTGDGEADRIAPEDGALAVAEGARRGAGPAIVVYAAMPEEVDVVGVLAPLRSRGWRVLFPRVRGDDLDLVAVPDVAGLTLGYRGIREPVGPRVDPSVVRAVLVPGVAFDPHGGRLGQGGGHYDRLLARLGDDAVRIGVAFACQLVPRVPLEPHDATVDVVVTDRAVHRRPRVEG